MRLLRLITGASILAGATLAAQASEGGGGAALIQPQFGTIFWTFITFILLALLLGRFAWKPLIGAVDEREKSIRESIDQAREGREEVERLLGEHREMLADARRERAQAVEQGKRDAEKVKAEIMEQAATQREQLMQQTQLQLDAGLRQARAELRVSAADLAIRAAEKLLVRNLDDATQRKLIEDYLTDLESSSGDAGSLPA
jgi:F-type H+-transporting ATPase subunit b